VKDNNLGLVGQVKTALVDQNIKQLTRTYSTITSVGLLENTGLAQINDAEARILKMVESRGFACKINQQKGFILFENSGDTFDTDSTVNHLRSHIHEVVLLHKQIASIDRTIEQSDRYVQKKLLQSDKFPGGDREMGDTRGMQGMQGMGFHI